MKTLKHTLIASLLLLGPALAQPAYQPVESSAGYSTRVPAGFQVIQKGASTTAIDPGQNYMLVITPHSYANFEAFARDAQLERDGFTAVGEVEAINATDRRFRAAKQTAQGYLVADTFVTFSAHGGGTLIVALAPEAYSEKAFYAGLAAAQNLSHRAPQASPWQQALAGKHLCYLYTGNGYSERKDLYLLPGGEFVMRNDATSLSVNGSGALAGGGDGRWNVLGDQLVLQFHQGGSRTFQLSQRAAGNEVGLNGQRWFVMAQ